MCGGPPEHPGQLIWIVRCNGFDIVVTDKALEDFVVGVASNAQGHTNRSLTPGLIHEHAKTCSPVIGRHAIRDQNQCRRKCPFGHWRDAQRRRSQPQARPEIGVSTAFQVSPPELVHWCGIGHVPSGACGESDHSQ